MSDNLSLLMRSCNTNLVFSSQFYWKLIKEIIDKQDNNDIAQLKSLYSNSSQSKSYNIKTFRHVWETILCYEKLDNDLFPRETFEETVKL